ncbi:GNAT family N-acetyltransferase [Vagococcus sp. JNUCC 83]
MIQFECKTFDELSHLELFFIYKFRVEVFVVEQNCPYQEVDDIDLSAKHILGKNSEGKLVAYMRIYQKNTHWYIGRVIVKKAHRTLNYGKKLVSYGLSQIPTGSLIKAQAQAYLQEFYQSFGFKPISEVYLEDNIPHIDMTFIKL